MRYTFLGHAGWIVDAGDVRILMDPWYSPAFLGTWFPWPDNRATKPLIGSARPTHLYISHTHEDHLDVRFLDTLSRDITCIVPDYPSHSVGAALRRMGFTRQLPFGHRESFATADVTLTMYLDASGKEDSALLVNHPSGSFLNLNDAGIRLGELPSADVLTVQYSHASWYPLAYDYDAPTMQVKVEEVIHANIGALEAKVRAVDPRHLLLAAGPPIILDPDLAQAHAWGRGTEFGAEPLTLAHPTPFLDWEALRGLPGLPKQTEDWHPGPGDVFHHQGAYLRCVQAGIHWDVEWSAYRTRVRREIGASRSWVSQKVDVDPLTVLQYFGYLIGTNERSIPLGDSGEWKATLRLLVDGVTEIRVLFWVYRGARTVTSQVRWIGPDQFDTFPATYTITIPSPILAAILRGAVPWETALLSFRLRLSRDPDVYDPVLMGLLRYGHHRATFWRIMHASGDETLTRDGFTFARYCPHAGEDLSTAKIEDGCITCPRHGWRFDLRTGACLSGGNLPLRVGNERS